MANKKTDVKVDNEVVGTLQEENVESQKVTKESEHDDAFVSLRHIDKIYDNNVQAVFDFNLDIKKHEFIVFVGPSGCGKSTTLRMIAGLEDITKGELYIDNELCNDKTPKDRDIAMVFQSYALYPHMSVYENMAFGLKLRRLPKYEIDRRVHEAARILQIEEYLDRKPTALSGGQRQRVALGRAIIRHAKIFLMDEPLSNLDAKQRVSMRSELIKIHRKVGATTIYVTHDQIEAMTMADRIVVMSKGVIQQVGTPKELYFRPQNLFVAGFIGDPPMNFVKGKVASSHFVSEDGYYDIDLAKLYTKEELALVENKNITLAYRPEHVQWSVEDEKDFVKMHGVVEVSEMLGDIVNVYINLGKSKAVAKSDPEHDFKIDSEVNFYVNKEDIRLFDSETENLII